MHRTEGLKPIFFGPPSAQLYGCLHLPAQVGDSREGVVLCNPLGHEYVRSHRALLVLAQRLARSGFTVLRFDWSGCGDSHGSAESFTLEAASRDLQLAAAELGRVDGVEGLSVVGRRLGGTVALTTAAAIVGLRRLVLWDPVVDGESYLADLASLHRGYVTTLHGTAPRPMMELGELGAEAGKRESREYLGQHFSGRLLGELSELDLRRSSGPAGNPTLLVGTADEASISKLAEVVTGGEQVALWQGPDPDFWQTEELLKQTVSNDIVVRIVRWLKGDGR